MTPVTELISVRHTDLYIDGGWRPASDGQRIDVTDPATAEVIATVASASVPDALKAVEAAEKAFRQWSARPPRERAEMLRKTFELMMRDQDKLAELMVRENGKTLAEARGEVAYAAEFFRWFSEEAVRNIGSVSIAPSGANRILVEHQPIGVSVLVTPWNFPAAMATRKIGPALAAGCTVVLKPASETPLSALAVADLLEQAGVPKGVVNVIPSKRSAEVVKAMLKDSRVRKLSFTGSTEVGRILLAQAAENVISCSMERGGNAPFIVLADADLDAALEGAIVAKMRNTGQSCIAANRFYAEAPVAEKFSSILARRDVSRCQRGDRLCEQDGSWARLLRVHARPGQRPGGRRGDRVGHGRTEPRIHLRPGGALRRGQAERDRPRGLARRIAGVSR